MIQELPIEEIIINYIFDEIFEKRFHPGMKLAESIFAQTFNTNRDTVRKAFSQLQSMGLVTYKKNQGFFLRWLTQQDTEDVYTARNIIEAGVITIITQKHTLGLIDLSSLKDEVETEKYLKISLRNGEYVKTSCDFHLNLALLSENDFLINALKPLIPLSILAGLVYEDSNSCFCSYDEHNNLIQAIKSNDIDYAKSIMNHHLHHCVEALDFTKEIQNKSTIVNIRTA